jgi:glucosamine--fructose-6-phosphate aminotransferase (isomerizing)
MNLSARRRDGGVDNTPASHCLSRQEEDKEMGMEYHTYTEITSQPEAWSQALELTRAANLGRLAEAYDQVIFTGCGSSYYLSLAAAALYQELAGRLARAVPAGELLLNPRASLGSVGNLPDPARDEIPTQEKVLLVAISRSGTTTETVRAVEAFRAREQGDVLVISNQHTVLASLGNASLVIPKGQEESTAQTRSFASMYVAASAFCARSADRADLLDAMDRLPEVGTRLIRKYESFARESGEDLDFDRFYFLGSGIRYGLACEVNLKMKEMTLTHSEPFHFLEFRHGPMSMVNQKAVIVGMLSEQNASHEQAVLDEMRALGGRTIRLAEAGADVAFESLIPDSIRGVLFLPVLQLMAFYRSLAKGLNPDRPNNLTAVVQLNM